MIHPCLICHALAYNAASLLALAALFGIALGILVLGGDLP